MNAQELRAKRANVVKNSRELLDKVEKEGRDFNAEETAQWNRLDADVRNLGTQIERADLQEKREHLIANEIANDPTGLRNKKPGSAVEDLPAEDATGIIPHNEAKALAVQGWFMRNSSDDDVREQFTERHARAQKQTGIGRNSKMLNIAPPSLGQTNTPDGPLQSIQNYRRIRQQLRQRMAWDGAQGNYVNINPLTSQTGSGGGFLVPEGFSAQFETALLAYGYMLQVADVMTTPGANPLPWPTANDTSNKGRMLNQNAATDNTGANIAYPKFGAVMFYAYKATSDEILVPFELIRDNAVGLVDWLGEALGIRIGRIANDQWTTGTGNSQCTGIVQACTVGKTAASATAIKWDEVIDLEHSVDPAYRGNPGVGYMCHDGIIQALRKLKDGEGRYLWQQSANSGEPDRLNNRPLTRNQSMQATVATGTQTLLFGDLSKYKIRRVGGTRMYRLVERYRDNDQDAFLAFEEFDGNLIDAGTHPVKSLKQA